MSRRRLTAAELKSLNGVEAQLLESLDSLAGADPDLLLSMRQRLAARLSDVERSSSSGRRRLRVETRARQGGLCPLCGKPLSQGRAKLDRLLPSEGFTLANTRLVHVECLREEQRKQAFSDSVL